MIEYEVEIKGRPLGVRFAHADRGETVVVHLVLENKIGHQLGLLPGDVLIAVNGESVLNLPSSEALEIFRKQEIPYKATFRRFEDDDEFDDDNENSVNESEFQREEASYLMHGLNVNHPSSMHKKEKSLQISDWTNDDVEAWLINYGKSEYNDEGRYFKYIKLFKNNNITGDLLKNLDKIQLGQMGINNEEHCHELYMAIQQLNRIYVNPQDNKDKNNKNNNNKNNNNKNNNKNNNNKNNKNNDDDDNNDNEDNKNDNDNDNGNDNDNDNDNDEKAQNNNNKKGDEPDWEAPFLPYMYDAPTIQLTDKTVADVYAARVVSPFKRQPFALYELEVKDGENEWLLSKRYSEFYRLYTAMKKIGIHTKNAKFPKKGLFGNNSTDKKVMDARKKSLTDYLNELLKDHAKARNSKELNEFLSPSRTFVVDE